MFLSLRKMYPGRISRRPLAMVDVAIHSCAIQAETVALMQRRIIESFATRIYKYVVFVTGCCLQEAG
jgi:hypothetical protein